MCYYIVKDMEDIMVKEKMAYKMCDLNNIVVYGKERMNTNAVKHFNVNENVDSKNYDDEKDM